MFSDCVTRFSDVCVEFKLCKLVKVSKKSSDSVRLNQSKLSEIPDRSRYKYNNTNTQHLQPCSLKLFRIYPVASVVVCLAEVNLSCFDQVLLLVGTSLPPISQYSRFSRDASLYCEKCISSNSPNANSFLSPCGPTFFWGKGNSQETISKITFHCPLGSS